MKLLSSSIPWILASCHPAPRVDLDPAFEIRYRDGFPADEAGERFVAHIQGARWDDGLLAAARELAASSVGPVRLSPAAADLALARAGFPGDARFARLTNGGAWPAELADEVNTARGSASTLDLALASRSCGDGTVTWILGWAPHFGELDPMPRDLALDEPLPLRLDLEAPGRLVVFVAEPDGPVSSHELSDEAVRWIDVFHTPGAWPVEVVDQAPDAGHVLFRFTVFVDAAAPPALVLQTALPPPDPQAATAWFYLELDRRRREMGLPVLEHFPIFEPLAREHAAYMASRGLLAHVIPGLTEGVAERAEQDFHPKARHTENLAAAYSKEEAMEVVWGSPGHRLNLLCDTCTHVAIGAALEPVTGVPPRLFVTWEMLSFPQGAPRLIERPR